MAINVDELLADCLIALCEEKPLSKISISDIQKRSGVSRQAFYNHFRDKHDLIQYIYLNRVIRKWKSASTDLDYYDSLVDSFHQYTKYHNFMKQACTMTGQNCLRDFMLEYCKKFDFEWHQKQYGEKPIPEALRFATEYHSIAAMSMTIAWILSDMPSSPEVMAENITKMRDAGLSHLLYKTHSDDNPYPKAANKAGQNNI